MSNNDTILNDVTGHWAFDWDLILAEDKDGTVPGRMLTDKGRARCWLCDDRVNLGPMLGMLRHALGSSFEVSLIERASGFVGKRWTVKCEDVKNDDGADFSCDADTAVRAVAFAMIEVRR